MSAALNDLAAEVRECTKCDLCKTRKRAVPGEGPDNAQIFIIGMNPGGTENLVGKPFVGDSGQMLNKMLAEAGIDRSECYVSNVTKCANITYGKVTDPSLKQIKTCQDYLIRELNIVRPRIVVALGVKALQWLEGGAKPKMEERLGQVFSITGPRGGQLNPFGEIVCIVNYHPSYILRDNRHYGQAVGVFRKMRSYLDGEMERVGDLFLQNPDPVNVVTTLEELEAFLQDWHTTFDSSKNVMSFDTETTSLDFKKSLLLGVSFSWGDEHSYYIPMKQTGPQFFKDDDRKWVPKSLPDYWETDTAQQAIQEVLKNSCTKVAVNLSFDVNVLRHHGYRINGRLEDMMDLYHAAVDPSCHLISLDEMCARYSNLAGWKRAIQAELGHEPRKADFEYARCRLEVLGPYGARDALGGHKLWRDLWPAAEKNKVQDLINNITIPTHTRLTEMEWNGMLVDVERCDQLITKFSDELRLVEEKAYELADHKFSMKSWQQVAQVLYKELKLTPYKLSKPNKRNPSAPRNPSTDKISLIMLASKHELPATIRRHRQLTKILGTYLIPIRDLALDSPDGRVRARFNLTGTVTGRCSSSNPMNFQNLPKREFPEVREIFIAPSGYKVVESDLSQLEIRLMAWFCEDPAMLEMVRSGLDFHTSTAARMYGVLFDEVTSDHRDGAKRANFAIGYDASVPRMVETALIDGLIMTEKEAKKFKEMWYAAFPGYLEWKKDLVVNTLKLAAARQPIRVRNAFMRFRDFTRKKMAEDRGGFERELCNDPVQGTGADICYTNGLVRLGRALEEANLDSKYVCTVHDSVMCEVRDDHVNQVAKLMYEIMPLPVPPVDVPLAVEVKAGQSWGTLKTIPKESLYESA